MNLIQELFNVYKDRFGSNNMVEMSIKRKAFIEGAIAMRDHMNAEDRLGSEFIDENQLGLEIVGGSDYDNNEK